MLIFIQLNENLVLKQYDNEEVKGEAYLLIKIEKRLKEGNSCLMKFSNKLNSVQNQKIM